MTIRSCLCILLVKLFGIGWLTFMQTIQNLALFVAHPLDGAIIGTVFIEHNFICAAVSVVKVSQFPIPFHVPHYIFVLSGTALQP